MTTTVLPSRMRGVSVLGWLIILVVIVVFGSASIKTAPAYLEYNTIKGLINSILQDPKVSLKSESELRNDLDKRFMINNITAIKASEVIFSREGGRVTAIVDYEVRENLFGNLDLIMAFSGEFTKDGSQ